MRLYGAAFLATTFFAAEAFLTTCFLTAARLATTLFGAAFAVATLFFATTARLTAAGFAAETVFLATTARLTAATNTQGYATAAVANSMNDIGVFYKAGPIDAGVSNLKQSAVVNQTTAFASYTMGAAKVIVGMHSQNNLVATTEVAASGTTAPTLGVAVGKIRGTNIGASYALTPTTTVFGNVARADDKTTNDRDLSMTAVGVKYELSKRTS